MIVKATFEEQYYPLLTDSSYTIVKDIILYQPEDTTIENIVVKIWIDNELFQFDTITIPVLASGKQYVIPHIKQYTHHTQLRALSEKITALVTISISDDQTVVTELKQEITIFPLDSFPGFEHIKALAKYVMPNHSYTYELKQQVAVFLEKYKFHTAFEGYQSLHKQRIVEMITALFYALKEEKWVYSSLPPSYEKNGQRIRLIDQIKQQRFGNCIDLSLVICACLEAMDLHPMLILIPGHAFVGCWLTPSRLDVAVSNHKSDIANRLAKGTQEIVVWEATAVCVGSTVSFKNAVATAEQFIIGEKAYQCALDIKTARILNIQPLNILNQQEENVITQDFRLKGAKTKEEFITLHVQETLDIQALNKLVKTVNKRYGKENYWT
jgi:hypothetical protein